MRKDSVDGRQPAAVGSVDLPKGRAIETVSYAVPRVKIGS